MNSFRCALAAALVLLFAAPASAHPVTCDTEWNGTTGSWHTATNWSNGVPAADKTACIDAGLVTVTQAAEAKTLDVGDGSGDAAKLQLTGGEFAASLRIYGGGHVRVDGTLELVRGGPGDSVVTVDNPNAVTNNGTIVTTPGGSAANVLLDLKLNNNGTVDLNDNTGANGHDWTNNGAIDIAAGRTFTFDGGGQGPVFRHEAGNIAVNGTFVQRNGDYIHAGGTVTGFVSMANTRLNASGPGAATYLFIPMGAGLGGGELSGDIAADKTVAVRNDTASAFGVQILPNPIVNRGTIVLDGTGQIDFGNASSVENRGLIRVLGTGVRQWLHPLVNAAGGTLELARAIQFNQTFKQQTGATLDVDVNNSVATQLTVQGAATLGGTLRVTTTGATSGSTRVVQAGSRTGTFAQTNFVGAQWDVGYDATGAFLTDPTVPEIALSGKKTQELGKTVKVGVRSNEACNAVAKGKLVADGEAFKLKKASGAVPAGEKKTLKPKVPRKARRAAKKALEDGEKATAKLNVSCKDAAGNVDKQKRNVNLTL